MGSSPFSQNRDMYAEALSLQAVSQGRMAARASGPAAPPRPQRARPPNGGTSLCLPSRRKGKPRRVRPMKRRGMRSSSKRLDPLAVRLDLVVGHRLPLEGAAEGSAPMLLQRRVWEEHAHLGLWELLRPPTGRLPALRREVGALELQVHPLPCPSPR
eukprot:CAMPEP_0176240622 /NCGR_PEP_ID=MMETSP0121_2-20121125/29471_1 /TAXON_ID=160619 /ORGANISM="Kryptoperidinium foliaceum, Strain CCMP 1326" /LENGTH=156 /DNA_ID=CAMNT_0017580125 /DNA_START=235 /DNA_END=703 /DNA_ORIENTATION=-